MTTEDTDALREKLDYLSALLDHLPAAMVYLSPQRQVRWVNRDYAALFGTTPQELLGRPGGSSLFADLLEHRAADLEEALAGRAQVTEWYARTDGGEFRWMELSWIPHLGPDGAVRGVFGVFRDIHEARAATERLNELARVDPLTGLPNRAALLEAIQEALSRAGRYGHEVVVLFADLDDFKALNETHGSKAGDDLLRVAADRIEGVLRTEDLVARVGSDEFVALIETREPLGAGTTVAGKIQEALRVPFPSAGGEMTISASLGIASTRVNGWEAAHLLERAESAMSESRLENKGGFRTAAAD